MRSAIEIPQLVLVLLVARLERYESELKNDKIFSNNKRYQ